MIAYRACVSPCSSILLLFLLATALLPVSPSLQGQQWSWARKFDTYEVVPLDSGEGIPLLTCPEEHVLLRVSQRNSTCSNGLDNVITRSYRFKNGGGNNDDLWGLRSAVYHSCFDPSRRSPLWVVHLLSPFPPDGNEEDNGDVDDVYQDNGPAKWDIFEHVVQGGNGDVFIERIDHASSNHLYDRGHLAPAGDMLGCRERAKATLHVANRAPHESLLNQRQWNGVEKHIRRFVRHVNETVLVVTGVAGIEGMARERGSTGQLVAIPRYWWKVVVTRDMRNHLLFFTPNLSVQIAPAALSLNSPGLPPDLRDMLRRSLAPQLFWLHSMHAAFNNFVQSSSSPPSDRHRRRKSKRIT